MRRGEGAFQGWSRSRSERAGVGDITHWIMREVVRAGGLEERDDPDMRAPPVGKRKENKRKEEEKKVRERGRAGCSLLGCFVRRAGPAGLPTL
jgi:hypothetical protein